MCSLQSSLRGGAQVRHPGATSRFFPHLLCPLRRETERSEVHTKTKAYRTIQNVRDILSLWVYETLFSVVKSLLFLSLWHNASARQCWGKVVVSSESYRFLLASLVWVTNVESWLEKSLACFPKLHYGTNLEVSDWRFESVCLFVCLPVSLQSLSKLPTL